MATKEQIRTLRQEAGAAGDRKMIEICETALGDPTKSGTQLARIKVDRVLREAEGRRSGKHAEVTAASLKRRGFEYWRRQHPIQQGQFDNLVYDDGRFQVWVSRMTLDDYNGDLVTWNREKLQIDERVGGRWLRRVP